MDRSASLHKFRVAQSIEVRICVVRLTIFSNVHNAQRLTLVQQLANSNPLINAH